MVHTCDPRTGEAEAGAYLGLTDIVSLSYPGNDAVSKSRDG